MSEQLELKPQPEAFVLPRVEEQEVAIDFMAELEKCEGSKKVTEIKRFVEKEEGYKAPEAITEEDIIILQLLMASIIGTASQRGSITRIINTLRGKYVPEMNVELHTSLLKRVREQGLPF